MKPKLKGFCCVTISFDLWMSRGCQDIFNLIKNRLYDIIEPQNVHLRLVDCNSTAGSGLVDVFKEYLAKFGSKRIVIACVKDSGSNLAVRRRIINELVSYQPLQLRPTMHGIFLSRHYYQ